MDREWQLMMASQCLLKRLQRKYPDVEEEILFLDFRPRWLIKQLTVYNALARHACAICFNDTFIENIAIQHNLQHPVVCMVCYARLRKCPFCRISLTFFLAKWPRLSIS